MADTPTDRPTGRMRIYPAAAGAPADAPPSGPATLAGPEPAVPATPPATPSAASTRTRDIVVGVAICVGAFVIGALLEPGIGTGPARLLWLLGGLLGAAYVLLYRKHGFRRTS